MAASSSSNDGFGNFMRSLDEKSSEEIDRNYFSRQKGVVLRKYLVLHGVQTSDLSPVFGNDVITTQPYDFFARVFLKYKFKMRS